MHVFLIMKFLLTKRLYYHLTRIFNRYNGIFKYINEENKHSLLISNDKRLMNIFFNEKNSSQYDYHLKSSEIDSKNKRFVNCLVCM